MASLVLTNTESAAFGESKTSQLHSFESRVALPLKSLAYEDYFLSFLLTKAAFI